MTASVAVHTALLLGLGLPVVLRPARPDHPVAYAVLPSMLEHASTAAAPPPLPWTEVQSEPPLETPLLPETSVADPVDATLVEPSPATDPGAIEPPRERADLATLAMQRIRPPRPCEPQATEPPQPIAAAQFEQSAAADAVASPEVPVVVPGDNPAPDYPAAAVRRRLEGTVTIEIQVDAAGTAHQCRVLQTTGYGLLDDAALAAARRWRFDRGPGTVQVPFAFRLHRRG